MRGRFLINLIALFIPSRNLRHRLRRWKGFETRMDRLEKEIAYLTRLVSFVHSPSSIPPAQGLMRGVQLIMVEKLKELVSLFDAHGVEYWLDFGSLLGAVRHGGFVPWDEDLDIAIRLQDRPKVINLLQKEGIEYYTHGSANGLLSVVLFKTSSYVVHIDIMAYALVENISDADVDQANELMVNLNRKYACYSEEYHEEAMAGLASLQKKSGGNRSLYVRCVDSCLLYPTYTVPQEVLFPLASMPFEGTSFKIPHCYEEYLTALYKDYMQWPPVLHTNYIINQLSEKERLQLIGTMKQQLHDAPSSCLRK